jgi:gliding motility-associated-like protein
LLASYPGSATGLDGQNGGSGLVQICFKGTCQATFANFDTTTCSSFTNELGITFDSSGTYTYTLVSESGCDSIVSIDLTIRQAPPVSISATSISIALGDSVQLSASGALNYLWSPDTFLTCSNCATTIVSPEENITYVVTGVDTFGCRSSDTLDIEVDIICSTIFIPTIFSPNRKGPQANEKFCVFSNCVEQFKLLIFNRWGEKVFESEDISNCWDGTSKGIEVQSGLYAYNLYVKQLDGTVVNKTGTITLVK